jgi:hypothetical protein
MWEIAEKDQEWQTERSRKRIDEELATPEIKMLELVRDRMNDLDQDKVEPKAPDWESRTPSQNATKTGAMILGKKSCLTLSKPQQFSQKVNNPTLEKTLWALEELSSNGNSELPQNVQAHLDSAAAHVVKNASKFTALDLLRAQCYLGPSEDTVWAQCLGAKKLERLRLEFIAVHFQIQSAD